LRRKLKFNKKRKKGTGDTAEISQEAYMKIIIIYLAVANQKAITNHNQITKKAVKWVVPHLPKNPIRCC
jgi:hypothetical protein